MCSLCGGPRAAARPGALLYSYGKSPFPGQGSSPAQHCVPYFHHIFLTGTGAEGSMPEQSLDGLALPALAGAGQDLGVVQGSGWALEEPTSTL